MLWVKPSEYDPIHGLRLSTALRQCCRMSTLARQLRGIVPCLLCFDFPSRLFEGLGLWVNSGTEEYSL
jgi:hypothetical protein